MSPGVATSSPRSGPRIGELRHRVVLEKKDANGNYGSPQPVSAKIEPVGGGARPRAGAGAAAPVSQRAFVITIRYRPGITHLTSQVHWGTRLFDIRTVVDPDERQRWLELHCEEIIPFAPAATPGRVDEYGEPVDV